MCKKNVRTGFTLIELLAIIVILAIIAVITVPIILGIIDNSKIGAIKDSAYGYKDAVQKSYLSSMIDNSSDSKMDGNYLINSEGNLTDNDGNVVYSVLLSGNVPSGGYLNVQNNVISSGCIQFDEYVVGISGGKVLNPKKGICGAELYKDIASDYKDNVNGNSLADGSYLINSDGRLRDLTGVVVLPSVDSNPNGGYLNISGGSISSGCMQFGGYSLSISGGNVDEPVNGVCPEIDVATSVVYNCSDSNYSPDSESWFTTMNMGGDLYITGYSSSHPSDNTDLRLPCSIGGNTVKGIFYTAFNNKGLTSVVIPNGISDIKSGAFQNNSLISLSLPGSISNMETASFSENDIRKLSLGNGMTQIGSQAFANNKIKEVSIPSSVNSIGTGAFNNNLFDDSSAFIYDLSDSTKLISYAGANKDVTIPSNVVTIGDGAFTSCGLTSVVIPNGVTTIGSQAFEGNRLTNVVIPNSVTVLDQQAFRYNDLHEVTIGSGVVNNNSQSSAFLKNSNSNSNLTTIHNLTGHSFDWGSMINGNGSSALTFEIGTVTNSYGDVEVLGE